jgi:two-component system CheB/CheR fusion protein
VGNEELQAASEEVETLNEELQATNEELETLNEELQATVEELKTTSDDLEARSVATAQDTAEAAVERAASEQDRRYLVAAIIDYIGYAVAAVNARGEIVLTNTVYDRLFGSGREAVRLEAEDGAPLDADAHPLGRLTRDTPFRMRFTVRDAAGQRRLYEADGRSIHGDEGAAGRVLVVREIIGE